MDIRSDLIDTADHLALLVVKPFEAVIEAQQRSIEALTASIVALSERVEDSALVDAVAGRKLKFDDEPEGAYGGDGKASVSEAVYQNVLHRLEETQEDADRAYEALERASVMLGYGGDVSEDFFKYLRNRPKPGDEPAAYALPDDTRTNDMSEALASWVDYALSLKKEHEQSE